MGEKWAFSTKAEYELTGEYSLHPEGIYKFSIEDKTDKQTSKGDPMVALQCRSIEAGEGSAEPGEMMFHNVVCFPPYQLDTDGNPLMGDDGEPKRNKAHGFTLHFLHAVGLPYDGEVDFDTDEFIGREFWGEVVHEEYDKLDADKNPTGEKGTRAKIKTILIPEDGGEQAGEEQTGDGNQAEADAEAAAAAEAAAEAARAAAKPKPGPKPGPKPAAKAPLKAPAKTMAKPVARPPLKAPAGKPGPKPAPKRRSWGG